MSNWRPRVYSAARAVARLPPSNVARYAWPYLVPGAPRWFGSRWERMVRDAPVVEAQEHADAVGLNAIEEVIGCSLCDERRMRPLLRPRSADGSWSYHVVGCPECG